MLTRICARLALALLVTTSAGIAGSASAQVGTVVSIRPAAGAYQLGETFAVEVRIDDVSDLYGVDVRVTFDPACLEVVETAVTPGTDLLSPPWLILFNQVDNQTGTIWYVVTLLNPHPPVSGSGVLYSFHFKTLAMGSAAVGITELTLSDINGELIPATTAGAVYQVGHQAFLPLAFNESSGGRRTGGAVGASLQIEPPSAHRHPDSGAIRPELDSRLCD
jgi:hypothetical protein